MISRLEQIGDRPISRLQRIVDMLINKLEQTEDTAGSVTTRLQQIGDSLINMLGQTGDQAHHQHRQRRATQWVESDKWQWSGDMVLADQKTVYWLIRTEYCQISRQEHIGDGLIGRLKLTGDNLIS